MGVSHVCLLFFPCNDCVDATEHSIWGYIFYFYFYFCRVRKVIECVWQATVEKVHIWGSKERRKSELTLSSSILKGGKNLKVFIMFCLFSILFFFLNFLGVTSAPSRCVKAKEAGEKKVVVAIVIWSKRWKKMFCFCTF